MDHPEVTFLFPCLNEQQTIGICLERVQRCAVANNLDVELLVADNGSDDHSVEIANNHGARVVHVERRGYGAALWKGIQSARGRFILFADADDSYYVSQLPLFLEEMRGGGQFVIGNRFGLGVEPGAMPLLNRYVGNPVLSGIGRLLFGGNVADWHCGLRGGDRHALLGLDLRSPGMEFASEMVAKALLDRLRIKQIPTGLRKDGRDKAPHLRPWRDGLRHLGLMFRLKGLEWCTTQSVQHSTKNNSVRLKQAP